MWSKLFISLLDMHSTELIFGSISINGSLDFN